MTHDLGRFPVGKLIVKMSVPSVIGVMAYNIYNLFDTMIVSRGAGMDALGGVAVSFPLFLFLSAVSSTLGGGAASMISRALGEHDRERAAKTAGNTMGLFYLTAILVTVFGLLFLQPLLYGMDVTDTLLPYAKRYMGIILLGAVTSTGFSGLICSSLQSIQATYFQAIGKRSASVLLALCDGVLCFLPVTAVMSRCYGMRGIWLSFPVSAALAFLISSVFTVNFMRKTGR